MIEAFSFHVELMGVHRRPPCPACLLVWGRCVVCWVGRASSWSDLVGLRVIRESIHRHEEGLWPGVWLFSSLSLPKSCFCYLLGDQSWCLLGEEGGED